MSSRKVALLGAVLYMVMPYHLAVDFYRRTALPECWALVWMPLILYFSDNVIKGRVGAIVGLAIAFALLVLSHPITLIMFSLIPLAVAVSLSAPGQKLQSVLRVVQGMVLGTGLSCFYLLSAFPDSRYFPVSKLLASGNYNLADNLIGISKLSHSSGIIRTIAMTVTDMLAFIAICGAVALWKTSLDSRKKGLFWITVYAVPIFLMTTLSYSFWNMLPWLHGAIQLPWRLNILLCVAALPLLAGFLSKVSWVSGFPKILAISLVSLLVVTWIISYGAVWKYYRTDTAPAKSPIFSYNDDWFESWSAPGLDQASALRASAGPRAKFLTGAGTLGILLWKPRYIEIQSGSQTGGLIRVNQFYYPQWRAVQVNTARPLDITPAMPEGLLQVQAPAGVQRIRLEIPVDAPEHVGRWISAICVLLCLILLVAQALRRFAAAR